MYTADKKMLRERQKKKIIQMEEKKSKTANADIEMLKLRSVIRKLDLLRS
jgi:hypothetical protein